MANIVIFQCQAGSAELFDLPDGKTLKQRASKIYEKWEWIKTYAHGSGAGSFCKLAQSYSDARDSKLVGGLAPRLSK